MLSGMIPSPNNYVILPSTYRIYLSSGANNGETDVSMGNVVIVF